MSTTGSPPAEPEAEEDPERCPEEGGWTEDMFFLLVYVQILSDGSLPFEAAPSAYETCPIRYLGKHYTILAICIRDLEFSYKTWSFRMRIGNCTFSYESSKLSYEILTSLYETIKNSKQINPDLIISLQTPICKSKFIELTTFYKLRIL
jgi:hypothetical protein